MPRQGQQRQHVTEAPTELACQQPDHPKWQLPSVCLYPGGFCRWEPEEGATCLVRKILIEPWRFE